MISQLTVERAVSAAFVAVIGRDPCELDPVLAVPLVRRDDQARNPEVRR